MMPFDVSKRRIELEDAKSHMRARTFLAELITRMYERGEISMDKYVLLRDAMESGDADYEAEIFSLVFKRKKIVQQEEDWEVQRE